MNDVAPRGDERLLDQLYEELLYSPTKERAISVLSLLQEDDPETITLALELIATGNDEAQYRVQGRVCDAITNLAEAEYPGGSYHLAESCPDEFSPRIKHGLRTVWNVAQLMEETGIHDRMAEDYESEALELHTQINPDPDADLSKDDVYWRGMVALALTDRADDSKINDFEPFARYAGAHGDLTRVIRLADERNILNPELLEALIQEQNENPTAVLSNGVL